MQARGFKRAPIDQQLYASARAYLAEQPKKD
jgi:hypothetical protein